VQKVVLICHRGDLIEERGLTSWIASFAKLAGVVAIVEPKPNSLLNRIRHEYRRGGTCQLLDVLAFRTLYKLCHSGRDSMWLRDVAQQLESKYAVPKPEPAVLVTSNPNSNEVRDFLKSIEPHMAIARCKRILKKSIFSIPIHGTYVLHPGICPEYRNSHGCFWALARGELGKVGATLLRINDGVDTGPVYGYFPYRDPDPLDSHIKIQYRAVIDNLVGIQQKLLEIMGGEAQPLSVAGRESAVYGQPWLSKYLAFRRNLAAFCNISTTNTAR
jgi:hypothetical protein